ncbi:hypothetical protein BpHYR1_041683 [Brachionus plicatilis]|uniref:Uncharacterized protein n=1 Tax=Brachionus plicatilis TaxID=10195 RepID=A0A3M7STH8_BRAPC|nr:hypothetical protein BpHYR1_041683 [Brachionus plicatilis]
MIELGNVRHLNNSTDLHKIPEALFILKTSKVMLNLIFEEFIKMLKKYKINENLNIIKPIEAMIRLK